MTALRFDLALPDAIPGKDLKHRFKPLLISLEALTQINQWHFQCGDAVPLEDSGVVYVTGIPMREEWADCVVLARRKRGDCKELAPYLAAQIRELYGVAAECVLKWKFISRAEMLAQGYPLAHTPPDGAYLVHVLVRLPNDIILDPSEWLGMDGEA